MARLKSRIDFDTQTHMFYKGDLALSEVSRYHHHRRSRRLITMPAYNLPFSSNVLRHFTFNEAKT